MAHHIDLPSSIQERHSDEAAQQRSMASQLQAVRCHSRSASHRSKLSPSEGQAFTLLDHQKPQDSYPQVDEGLEHPTTEYQLPGSTCNAYTALAYPSKTSSNERQDVMLFDQRHPKKNYTHIKENTDENPPSSQPQSQRSNY